MPNGDALATWIDSLPPEWSRGVDAEAIRRAHAAYQSPPRQYHTWAHVLACVEQLKSFHCDDPRVVFLALVFHDGVYVSGHADNEEKSAALAREVLSAYSDVSPTEIASIERMIRSTRNHHARAADATADEATMLDVDLSILAASRDEYVRYAKAIRDEYVPSATTEIRFRIGRLEFLEHMLTAPHVFISADAQQRWDALARDNISWEIGELRREQGMLERVVSAVRRP